MRGFGKAAVAAALALSIGGVAHATTLMNDTFDSEGGATQLNFTGFADWNVTGGTVDLIHQGGFGLSCAGGAGNCVDLDGTTFQGGTMTTKGGWTFHAGDTVTVSALVGGDQRGGTDDFSLGFKFFGATNLISYSTGGAFGDATPFSNFSTVSVETTATVHSADPYKAWTISFVAGQAGSFDAFVSTNSNDEIGPMLDTVTIDLTSASHGGGVPEPATWAMMLTGFAGLGSVLRRRRSVAAA